MAFNMDEVLYHQIWVPTCLDAARSTPGFCEGVPSDPFRMQAWVLEACDRGDMACNVAMQGVWVHCRAKDDG
ncbi:MAG TPA: hypothetical protein QGF58_03115 [Myxococcota bacterium]|nr:hypothetical protein [Myxococcota bacterium]